MLIQSFLNDLKKRYKGRDWEGTNHGMVSEYLQTFSRYITPLYGEISVDKFRSDDLLTLRQAMCDDGLYLDTINKRLFYIKQAFKHGLPKEWVDGNHNMKLEAVERIQENTYGVPTRKKQGSVRIELCGKNNEGTPLHAQRYGSHTNCGGCAGRMCG